jgi:hypothetical protein
MTKKEAYEAWQQWLEKCPVWFLKLRTPTVDLETVQFDLGGTRPQVFCCGVRHYVTLTRCSWTLVQPSAIAVQGTRSCSSRILDPS